FFELPTQRIFVDDRIHEFSAIWHLTDYVETQGQSSVRPLRDRHQNRSKRGVPGIVRLVSLDYRDIFFRLAEQMAGHQDIRILPVKVAHHVPIGAISFAWRTS